MNKFKTFCCLIILCTNLSTLKSQVVEEARVEGVNEEPDVKLTQEEILLIFEDIAKGTNENDFPIGFLSDWAFREYYKNLIEAYETCTNRKPSHPMFTERIKSSKNKCDSIFNYSLEIHNSINSSLWMTKDFAKEDHIFEKNKNLKNSVKEQIEKLNRLGVLFYFDVKITKLLKDTKTKHLLQNTKLGNFELSDQYNFCTVKEFQGFMYSLKTWLLINEHDKIRIFSVQF